MSCKRYTPDPLISMLREAEDFLAQGRRVGQVSLNFGIQNLFREILRLIHERRPPPPETETGFETVPRNETHMNWFKTWHWFYRMQMAGRTNEEWRRAMYAMALIRLHDVLQTPWNDRNGLPQDSTVGEAFTSELAAGLLLRWHVRRPRFVIRHGEAGTALEGALQAAGLNGGNPADWGDNEEERLVNALQNQAGAPDTLPGIPRWGGPNWPQGRFALDPATLDPASPALRTGRGSFLLDAQVIANP